MLCYAVLLCCTACHPPPLCSSALMGIPFCVLPNEKDGTISLDRIKAAIKPDNVHYPVSRVVALENTQNRCVV